jgi:methylglutaconyl-CoA hydratase
MPSYQHLLIEKIDSVVTVSLNRPESRNAMDERTLDELAHCFLDLSSLKDARIVILRGIGPDFCAGADIRWMRKAADYSPAKNRKDAERLLKALKMIDECPVPVIARVHGGIYGGGLGLVAASDIVVAEEKSKMRFSECRLGILPSVISAFVVPKIGPSHARRLYLTGEVFGMDNARLAGLVHEILPESKMDRRVSEIVGQILLNGPEANRRAKAYLRRLSFLDPKSREEFSIKTLVKARSSKEAKEGLSAFLEKRPPAWVSNVTPSLSSIAENNKE